MAFTPQKIELTTGVHSHYEAFRIINENFVSVSNDMLSLAAGLTGGFEYHRSTLTGGGHGALDSIDGELIEANERALVIEGSNPGRVYIYVVIEDESLQENVPWVIKPDVNAGQKRWMLAARIPRLWASHRGPGPSDDRSSGVSMGDLWLSEGNIWICSFDETDSASWIKFLRTGTSAGTACEGNDPRIPSAGEKSALSGTSGSPGDQNRYVTDMDQRLSDPRAPTAHSHELDGDTIVIDWIPENSTPLIVEEFTSGPDELTSHLKGIDTAIANKSDVGHEHSSSHPPLTHSDRHAGGGPDEIDGDRLDIDWKPRNYVPRIVDESLSVDDLSSHLKGVDTALANIASDRDAIENTIAMMAWDLYSEDRAFDDRYTDDFTDVSGIDGTLVGDRLSGNSSGVYDSPGAFVRSAGSQSGMNIDVTTSQIDCSSWISLNAVTVTQSTPGDVPSRIYHSVSFDGGETWKVFVNGAWTDIVRNSAGRWQYWNQGVWTDASDNSREGAMILATDQAVHQWTVSDIEGMSGSDWTDSNGWSTQVRTIDWATRMFPGWMIVANGHDNNSETDAVPSQTDASRALASSETSGYEGWRLFNDEYGSGKRWLTEINNTTGWVRFDFGSNNRQVINKYRWRTFEADSNAVPGAWQFQGSDDGSSWTTLHEGTNTIQTADTWIGWFRFTNSSFYRYYRMNVTANLGHSQYLCVEELEMAAAQTAVNPIFEKVTFNHDMQAIPLDIVTNSWEASADDPDDAYCVLDIEPDDTITLNSDMKAFVSINDGANWEQITLEDEPFRTIGVHHYVRGDCHGITGRSDRTVRFRFTTYNDKGLKLRAIAGGVRYHD